MANCNNNNGNSCPPDPDTLKNAINRYKKSRVSIGDTSVNELIKIIDELKNLIDCNVAIGTSGTSGADGKIGESGTSGTSGETGKGVPAGGEEGQILAKASDSDYDTHWITQTQPLPNPGSGGTSGADGADGANSARWYYDPTNNYPTTQSENFIADNITLQDVTNFAISYYSIGNVDLYSWFNYLKNNLENRTVILQVKDLGKKTQSLPSEEQIFQQNTDSINSVIGYYLINSVTDSVENSNFVLSVTSLVTNGEFTPENTYSISWVLGGLNGTDGDDGTSGTAGTSGFNGTSGTSGTSGFSGTSGTSGKNGSSGTSGIDGVDGPNTMRWIYYGIAPDQDPYGTYFTSDYAELDLLTRLTISIYDINQTNLSNWLSAIETFLNSENAIFLQVYEVGNSSVLGIYNVVSIQNNFLYYTLELSPFVTNGILDANNKYAISWVLNGVNGTSGTSGGGTSGTSSFIFPTDLPVTLSSSKTFGRYKNGDVIPAEGKTVAEVIELAINEPLKPSLVLSSSTVILFNQTNIDNLIEMSYVINSYDAAVYSAVLEWRRNDTGDWTELTSDTTTPLQYSHTLTDSNYNSQSFNYRYTVTDTVGESSYLLLNLTPTTYQSPSVNLKISASSFSYPETYTKRESGNFKSILTGSVESNNPYIPLKTYSVQYDINDEEQWMDVPGLNDITILDSPQTIPSTIHDPIGNNLTSSIAYRIQTVDGFQTSSFSASYIDFKYMMYYGTSSTVPTLSSQIRRLSNRIFADSPSPTILNTEDSKIFVFATPFTSSAYYGIYEVLDLDASYSNLIDRYVLYTFNVNDSGSNAIPYNVYVNSNAIAYTDRSHRHQIRHGFLSGSLYYSSSLWTLNWYTGPNYTGKAYMNVTLNNFNLVNPALVGSIQINSGSS